MVELRRRLGSTGTNVTRADFDYRFIGPRKRLWPKYGDHPLMKTTDTNTEHRPPDDIEAPVVASDPGEAYPLAPATCADGLPAGRESMNAAMNSVQANQMKQKIR